MKPVFENAGVHYDVPGRYRLHVHEKGITYAPTDGKKSVDVRFSEVGSIFLLGYCNSNRSYTVTFRDFEGKDIGEIQTDVHDDREYHNVREAKSILIAFAESKLTGEFPENIDNLDLKIASSLAEKDIYIRDGYLMGAKHRIRLSDIRRVKCITNGTLSNLSVHTKEKGGFLDKPDMKVPVNELTLPILEAAVVRNTGNVIDFTRGNGFDQKTCEFVLVRYMNSSFFANSDGSVADDWRRIAYNHIQSYQSDIAIPETR